MLNEQQIYLIGEIQTSQTRDQPYSDTFPRKHSSLKYYLLKFSKIFCFFAFCVYGLHFKIRLIKLMKKALDFFLFFFVLHFLFN